MKHMDAELAHAGEETTLSPLMLKLEQLRITPDRQLPPMDFLFRLFDKPCFPRRELVGITGKAKSGKTFLTSMLIACCQAGDVLALHRCRAQPLRVLWYDTEQSDESTQDILKNRILPLIRQKTTDSTGNVTTTNSTNETNNAGDNSTTNLTNSTNSTGNRTTTNSTNGTNNTGDNSTTNLTNCTNSTEKNSNNSINSLSKNKSVSSVAEEKNSCNSYNSWLKNQSVAGDNISCNSLNSLSKDNFDVFNVRAVEWKLRRKMLAEAVRRCHPDMAIVDGIRDLVNDINDGVLAQEVMEELLKLATECKCCIVCVLHQNKSGEDHNLRGWIGTELMNKAFEVYSCEKLMPERIFRVEQTLTRKYDIERDLYFQVGHGGLPVTSGSPAGNTKTTPSQTAQKTPLPPLNRKYLLQETDDEGKLLFDVTQLFLDAVGDGDMSGSELRDRVMQLSGISVVFKYNQLLDQALQQKVIEREVKQGRTIYRAAPF